VYPTAPIEIDSVIAAANPAESSTVFDPASRDHPEDDPEDVHQPVLPA
jgi:hypothetical protein